MAVTPPPRIGRFDVLRVLGHGGMGVVYLASDPLMGRQVAIKVLPPLLADQAGADRLMNEARLSGRFVHPNVIAIFEIGEAEGCPFFVMPYVEGRTLENIIKARDPIPLSRKLNWMLELCRGLAYAHGLQVVHRDIKPGNLMVDPQRVLRILDFGIAKVVATTQVSFTAIGTPAYMAPEQYNGVPVDARTDIYSAGLVLFELLTFVRARRSETPAQIYRQISTGELPRILDLVPNANPELVRVCERALDPDPAARYQTADAFGEALADCQADAFYEERGRRPAPSVTPARPTSQDDDTAVAGAPPAGPPAVTPRTPMPAPPPAMTPMSGPASGPADQTLRKVSRPLVTPTPVEAPLPPPPTPPPPPPVVVAPPPPASEAAARAWTPTPSPPARAGRPRWLWPALGAATVAVAVAVAWTLGGFRREGLAPYPPRFEPTIEAPVSTPPPTSQPASAPSTPPAQAPAAAVHTPPAAAPPAKTPDPRIDKPTTSAAPPNAASVTPTPAPPAIVEAPAPPKPAFEAPAWVAIPAGSFQMGCAANDRACEGDEQPAHAIRLRGFAMSRTEVTVEQFTAWAASEDQIAPPQPEWNKGGSHPIVNVTWQEASSFCRAAGGRLPTEAEWEYAARGGAAGQVYPWGDTFDRNRANGLGQGSRDTYQNTAPVGTFGANAFGLADMAGNVREWVRDWYADDAYGKAPDTDPTGPTGESGLKVTRGGSWFHYPQFLRTSARASQGPGSRRDFVGFRCAK